MCMTVLLSNYPALKLFVDGYIVTFRYYCKEDYFVKIHGLRSLFPSGESESLRLLLSELSSHGFYLSFEGDADELHSINVTWQNRGELAYYPDWAALMELASRACLSLECVLVMRILGQVISQRKVLYKALVLDLDNTLWPGILSEEGFNSISSRLSSEEGKPFLSFMRWVRMLAEEFGIWIAICSRNNQADVYGAIGSLTEELFPIKPCVSYIIANDNSKSDNLDAIAKQLSILPRSIVFIDDSELERDEVRSHSCALVPGWHTHQELQATLSAACVFNRDRLRLRDKVRRQNAEFLQVARRKNNLPHLGIKVVQIPHCEAVDLYHRTNQFRCSSLNDGFPSDAISLAYSLLIRSDLEMCSVVTYVDNTNSVSVLNWAISCRYFAIGLEEFILLDLQKRFVNKNISFCYEESEDNAKVRELINNYESCFGLLRTGEIDLLLSEENIFTLRDQTELHYLPE